MTDTPDWITTAIGEPSELAQKLEQIDYAVGVLITQALLLQKMIDEARKTALLAGVNDGSE